MQEIRIGFIGLGSRGYGLLRDVVLKQKEQVMEIGRASCRERV